MVKKIVTFIASAGLCAVLISPVAVKAQNVQIPNVSIECTTKDDAQKKSNELVDKWNALSDKQKAEVYKSIKGTLDAQAKFIDKLVKYDLMTKEDGQIIKDDMYARFDEMKKNDTLFSSRPQPEPKQNNGNGTKSNNENQNNTKPNNENQNNTKQNGSQTTE